MPTYLVADDIKTIARQLQQKYHHTLGDLNLDRIIFLRELESASKSRLATTKKVDAALKTVNNEHDYMIIVFQKRLEALLPAQIHVLVLQQLLCCESSGEKIRRRDVEDFYEVATSFGVDWQHNEECRDPLGVGDITLKSAPVAEPDKYEQIMVEDHGIASMNISSQFKTIQQAEEIQEEMV